MAEVSHSAIRAAVPADVTCVGQIVDAAYGSWVSRIGRKPGPMLDDYAKRVADGQVWVLENDAGIIGVLVLVPSPSGFLLDNIAVAPGHQGKGHGHVLLAFAEHEARCRGYRDIQLYTNALMTENIALYGRVGYVETARVTEHGLDRVYMAKRLATL